MKVYLHPYLLLKYFCLQPSSLTLPLGDYEAFRFYSELIHLYNKKWIARSQRIISGEISELPTTFPIIVRPKINLDGMGKEAQFISNPRQFQKITSPHLF